MGKPTSDSAITSAKIILYAQGISVVASVAGLIGLVIAYRNLTRGEDSSTPARIPTIS